MLGAGVLGSTGVLLSEVPARHAPCRNILYTERLVRLQCQLVVGRGSRGGKQGGSPGPQVPCPAARGMRNACPVVATCWEELQLPSIPPYSALLCTMPPHFVRCHSGDTEIKEQFPAGPKASSSTLPCTQPSPFPYFLLFPFQRVSYSIYNFLYYSTLIDYFLCGALLNVL